MSAFVILVYRNTTDLIDALESIKIFCEDYAAVIVNSYYDEATQMEFERIAKQYQCEVIKVENKGYSYGNNRGIEYFNSHYEYDYMIISNPDIIIRKFSLNSIKLRGDVPAVYAPVIRTKTGKIQNPFLAVKNDLAEMMIYQGFKENKRYLINMGVGMNKIIRLIFHDLLINKGKKDLHSIYAAHGSFLIVSRRAVELLGNVFDENMFLFAEENCLACRLYKLQIPMYMTTDIEILHKEDGSMKLTDINQYEIVRQSMIYYYEKYVKKV